MNPHQFAQQIKHRLEQLAWVDGSADPVFGTRGSVLVYAGSLAEDQTPPGFPFALVTIDAGEADQDAPGLIEQRFSVITAVEVAGDAMGEFAIIGGARPDLGSSAGAGVAEVAERVRSALQELTGVDGAHVQLSAASTAAPRTLGRGRHLAYDEFALVALCTSQPYYAAPVQLRRTGAAWSWVGAHCSSRFDWKQYRLAYKAGATPPATPADADGVVYTGSNTNATHTGLNGRAYSVFAHYDPRATGAAVFSSDGGAKGAFITT